MKRYAFSRGKKYPPASRNKLNSANSFSNFDVEMGWKIIQAMLGEFLRKSALRSLTVLQSLIVGNAREKISKTRKI